MPAFKASILALAATGFRLSSAIDLDVTDAASIRAAARALAYGVQSYYTANTTGAASSVGTFPPPSYWWMGGAIWGGMVDYWAYTDDSTWNGVISQALVAQANAPAYDYMPQAYYSSLGNDDQTFWALSALAADEYGFPTPQGQPDTFWRDLGVNVFNTQVPRWETSACGGGLRWQIFESNGRYTYKNSVSAGSLFQLAARLARSTGNQTYADWAVKTWDWMQGVGFISPSYQVFDGADMITNCTELNLIQWTYNPALLIYGTTMMSAFTGDQVWKERTDGLLKDAMGVFFSPYPNATDIMFEPACETIGTCNYDQVSFKAYLSRWLAKAAAIDPSINSDVTRYVAASAQAAAKACTGGNDGQTCGQKWYTGGYDGSYGPGQSLAALETVQALLLLSGAAARTQPYGDAVAQAAPAPQPSSTYSPPPPPPPTSTYTPVAFTESSGSAVLPGPASSSSTSTDPKSTASSEAPPPPPETSTYTTPEPTEPPKPVSQSRSLSTSSAPSTTTSSSTTTDPPTAASSPPTSMSSSPTPVTVETPKSTSTTTSTSTTATTNDIPAETSTSTSTFRTPTPTPVILETSETTSSARPTTSSASISSISSTTTSTTSASSRRTSTTTDPTIDSSIAVQSALETPTEPPSEPTSSSTDAAPRATAMANMAAAGALVAGFAILGA